MTILSGSGLEDLACFVVVLITIPISRTIQPYQILFDRQKHVFLLFVKMSENMLHFKNFLDLHYFNLFLK